jgi:hypothetical protein
MPHEIRIWSIGADDEPLEVERTRLNFESRLERWLDRDISILFDDLLIIGRQVDTDLGGYIDLLCIDGNGDLVIIELKRDKTPRDIVAQTLEYASWVNGLSSVDVSRISAIRLASEGGLEKAFRLHFGHELPETINEDHRMIIVAAEIDARCERVVKYLSERHGVNLNVATFQHFGNQSTGEYFASVFLLEPEQVEYQTRTRGTSKRTPNLTFEELEQIADTHGVGQLYRKLVEGLESYLIKSTTRSSIAFKGALSFSNRKIVRQDRKAVLEERIATLGDRAKTVRTIISLVPGESSAETGLCFQLYMKRFEEWTGRSEQEILSNLPANRETWSFGSALDDWSGFQGFVKTIEEADRFIGLLKH